MSWRPRSCCRCSVLPTRSPYDEALRYKPTAVSVLLPAPCSSRRDGCASSRTSSGQWPSPRRRAGRHAWLPPGDRTARRARPALLRGGPAAQRAIRTRGLGPVQAWPVR
jgi:hypothetical protein